ncbi:hypothetical protein M0813_17117 [Anaeramoeba flamelloides]|uniref:Uncharacterized protein n=1 Tax=Anaeramoeba flamelloides TaxID=1746091 RepID=A0ABQ8YY01_9EUKA|nr:hypothetical protein M0813_17117 [Anaeramoeba flamelloides]
MYFQRSARNSEEGFRALRLFNAKTEEEANRCDQDLEFQIALAEKNFANKAYQRENNTKEALSTHIEGHHESPRDPANRSVERPEIQTTNTTQPQTQIQIIIQNII